MRLAHPRAVDFSLARMLRMRFSFMVAAPAAWPVLLRSTGPEREQQQRRDSPRIRRPLNRLQSHPAGEGLRRVRPSTPDIMEDPSGRRRAIADARCPDTRRPAAWIASERGWRATCTLTRADADARM